MIEENSINGRPRRLSVGQLWSAKLLESSWQKPCGGYTFKLLHEDRYYCEETSRWRACFLGLKMHVDRHPQEQGHPQCWWFDDHGICYDDSDALFYLTRKERPNAQVKAAGVASPVSKANETSTKG